jgi:hypothetical protein
LKAKFEALPPEEQARIKAERAAKRAERKAKFEALPPQEKVRIKAERKKKREAAKARKAAKIAQKSAHKKAPLIKAAAPTAPVAPMPASLDAEAPIVIE